MSSENLLVPFDDVGTNVDNAIASTATTAGSTTAAATATAAATTTTTTAAVTAVPSAVADGSGVEVNNEVPGESDA